MAVGCGSSEIAHSTHPSPINFDKQINIEQKAADKPAEVRQKTLENCDLTASNGKDILKNLYNSEGVDISTYTPETDPDLVFIKQIKACPREEMINSIQEVRNRNEDDLEIKAKTSYLLVKLGDNKFENAKILLGTYSTYSKTIFERYKEPDYERKISNKEYPEIFRGDQIIYLVSDVIHEDDNDKAILGESFEIADEVDGGSAMMLFVAFGYEFEKSPEKFLKAIAGKPKKTKEAVFERMCFDSTKKNLIKDLSAVPKSSEVYPLSKQMLALVKGSSVCEEAEKESGR
jgi:hypothetical protein